MYINSSHFMFLVTLTLVFLRLLGHLASRPHPPCFDDGQLYCSPADSSHSTHYFVPVLSLLQVTAQIGAEENSSVVVDES